jgi:Dna[CI] antecedent, DciA
MAIPLKNVIASLFNDELDWRLDLFKNWQVIVGSLHSKMYLEKICEDTLIVGVYDVHWMHELHLMSRCIIETINRYLGKAHVGKIRFRPASDQFFLPFRDSANSTVCNRQHVNASPLTMEQKEALSSIKDDELQRSLQAFLYRCDIFR